VSKGEGAKTKDIVKAFGHDKLDEVIMEIVKMGVL
jgi:ribosome maturation protein Sdo1